MTFSGHARYGKVAFRAIQTLLVAALLAVGLAVLLVMPAGGQQIHRDGHESRDTVWIKGPSDASPRELAHAITSDVQHTGQSSETIQIEADSGTFVHYHYDTGRAPLGEDLSAKVWIKGNRPGVQLLARLVLPNERNPNNTQEPLTAIIRGDVYQTTSRWQPLEIRQPLKLARQQQQILRAELNRDVNLTDAFIDRLILNVYTGPGQTEVFVDDLEIGPVIEQKPKAVAEDGSEKLMGRPQQRKAVMVELEREQLRVGGKRFFFRAIRHTDTPLKVLRDAGFNTVWLDQDSTPADVAEAIKLGFWVVPSLPVGPTSTASEGGSADTFLTSNPVLGKTVSRFLEQDGVLFWDLGGGGLALEQSTAVASTARMVHALDPQRPLAADVWDGFQPYSRNVNLLGVHRWPLMTSLELPRYRDWLNQRRLLANPGTFLWTWVQTHLPDWHTSLVYEKSPQAGFTEPVGPLPEQIRLLTYTALAAGSRGLGFWSDRFLADSHQGRDRLLEMALLNQEIQMLEPLLVAAELPTWVETNSADVKAAVFHTEKAILVLPVWVGFGAQFVPGQAAKGNLTVVVPQVPNGTQAWEVSPGDVHTLKQERVAGGTKITLPEFGQTAAVVFTADNGKDGLVVHLQDQARRMRQSAAQWTHDLAMVEFDKVARVNEELESMGHKLNDGKQLMDDARRRVDLCVKFWTEGNYREAYLEGQRALRPLGIVMRGQWEEAAKQMDLPVSSPYAGSFFTLPRHWKFADQLLTSTVVPTVLPHGDFETTPTNPSEAWAPQEVSLDEVELEATRVLEETEPPESEENSKDSSKSGVKRASYTTGGEKREGTHPHSTGTGFSSSGGLSQGKEGNNSSWDNVGKPENHCLKLEIKPKNPLLPPAALERTFLAMHSPAVRLTPGSLVRITGRVHVPKPLAATADGAMLYDSAGGEPLAVRVMSPTKKWKQFTWYRKVPESGKISLAVALTGIGVAYFDDLKIEPLLPGTVEMPPESERTLRSPKPPKDEEQDKDEHKDGKAGTDKTAHQNHGGSRVQPASYQRP
jgi:hypothetical protein